jgi:hypothetical protein
MSIHPNLTIFIYHNNLQYNLHYPGMDKTNRNILFNSKFGFGLMFLLTYYYHSLIL